MNFVIVSGIDNPAVINCGYPLECLFSVLEVVQGQLCYSFLKKLSIFSKFLDNILCLRKDNTLHAHFKTDV